jgi:phenylalanine-4-hydroxylase
MFADPDFADFSHMIGLASLAASDECIDKLATCYWFTVEFGLCQQEGETKAYGAGLLSSFGELEWSCGSSPSEECRESGGITKSFPSLRKPELRPFVPSVVASQTFPITTYQPIYFEAKSLQDAKEKMGAFCDTEINQPFHPQYDALTQSIRCCKSVWRSPKTSTAQIQVQKQKDYFDNLEKEQEAARGQSEENDKN